MTSRSATRLEVVPEGLHNVRDGEADVAEVPQIDRKPAIGIAEHYREGDFGLHVHLTARVRIESHPVELCAVLKGHPVSTSDGDPVQPAHGELAHAGGDGVSTSQQQPMLVHVVELREYGKPAVGILSWVRLVRLELCPQRFWDRREIPFAFLLEALWVVEDRKLVLARRRLGEPPDDVVQSRSHVVQGVADEHADAGRRWYGGPQIRVHPDDVFAGIRIRLTDEAKASIVDEAQQGRIQDFEVIPGPLDLRSAPVEGMRQRKYLCAEPGGNEFAGLDAIGRAATAACFGRHGGGETPIAYRDATPAPLPSDTHTHEGRK